MMWQLVGDRLQQKKTGLCLTADGCDEPRDGRSAELERCARGCWSESRVNNLSQKWKGVTTPGPIELRSKGVVNGSAKALCLRAKNNSAPDMDLYDGAPGVFVGECDYGSVGVGTQWIWMSIKAGSTFGTLRVLGDDTDLCFKPPCCLTTSEMKYTAMSRAIIAQLIAATALPLGVILGVASFTSSADDSVLSGVSSFGSGALLFALAIHIYGEVLQQLGDGSRAVFEVVAMLVATVFGAILYSTLSTGIKEKRMRPLILAIRQAQLKAVSHPLHGPTPPPQYSVARYSVVRYSIVCTPQHPKRAPVISV
jgi:hypothetical protein